jgi:hypothetical protein
MIPVSFILDRELSPAHHAALERSIDRMVEVIGRAVNVVTIDPSIETVAREFLIRNGYRILPFLQRTGNFPS